MCSLRQGKAWYESKRGSTSDISVQNSLLSQIRIAASNVKPTSRAWNRFRMAWRKDVLKRADTAMFERGLALFKVYEPALAGLLAHNDAYVAQLQEVRASPQIWGLSDAASANHVADLPRVRSASSSIPRRSCPLILAF